MAIYLSKEWRENISKSRRGKFVYIPNKDTKLKMRVSKIGALNPNWRGGITPLIKSARASSDYKQWRKAVFERDKYTCVICGDNKGGNLEADHINSFSKFPELLYEVPNGRTLCIKCHRETETWGNKNKAVD